MADMVTPGPFLAALKTQMVARLAAPQALANVPVYLVAPEELASAADWLLLIRDTVVQSDSFADVGVRNRDETVTVPGAVQAYVMTRRGGDDAFQAAFDRAGAILAELVAEMRDNPPNVGVQTRSAIVSSVRWTPAAVARGGVVVRGEYALTYTARVT